MKDNIAVVFSYIQYILFFEILLVLGSHDIADGWYARDRFSHPGLTALVDYSKRKEPFLQGRVFVIVFYSMVVSRMYQGISNTRPVGYLFFETVVLTMIGGVVWQLLTKRQIVQQKMKALFERQIAQYADRDRTVARFVLEGNDAIAGFAEGALREQRLRRV